MWMPVRGFVAALLLSVVVGLPGLARATSFEDALGVCEYPQMFDLVIMRPIGLGMLATGTGIFVATAPWAILTVRSPAGPWRELVAAPWRFTFSRDLGECAMRTSTL